MPPAVTSRTASLIESDDAVGDRPGGEGEHDGAVVRLGGVGDLAVGVVLDQALEEGTVAGGAEHREAVDEIDVAIGCRRGGDVRLHERIETDHRCRVEAAAHQLGDDGRAFFVRDDHREIGVEIGDLGGEAGEEHPPWVVVDHGRGRAT